MKLKRIAIIGAGAVGSYIFWGLSQKEGIDLYIVASGSRKERLESEGLLINDTKYSPKVCTPSEAHGVDLLIVTTKYNALRASLSDIEAVVDGHTIVMSLLNGVDSEEIIGSEIGMDKMMYSLIRVASERNGNSVRFDSAATIGVIFGEIDEKRGSERVDAVSEFFSGSGVNYIHSKVILSEIWSKFKLNIANNQPQAMVNCGVGAYTDSEHVAFIQSKLRDEVDLIAKAKGIDLSLADASFSRPGQTKKRARFSTLQDLDAGRHTEVDMFAGAVVRMGKELGIATPYNEFTYHFIKALEEKNDGLFDYE